MSRTSFCSGRRSITGYGVSGSNSVELAPSMPGHVARELGHRDLHAEADAEVRHAALAREPRGADLALHAAHAEAAGDQDAVALLELALGLRAVDRLGVDPADLDASRRCGWPAWPSASITDR